MKIIDKLDLQNKWYYPEQETGRSEYALTL